MDTLDNKARKTEYQQTSKGVVPVYDDQIVEQPYEYTKEEHWVWRTLLANQKNHIKNKATKEYLKCMSELFNGREEYIPKFSDINEILIGKTGWQICAVNGLLSDVAFFNLLSRKKFPVTWWIRSAEKIDYIQEPDLFHDLFGHVPLLMSEEYSKCLESYGRVGFNKCENSPKAMEYLTRMYWHTIEFGLIEDNEDNKSLKAFGAGLLSSPGEIIHALGPDPEKAPFKLSKVVRTGYKIDAYQPVYYVLKNYEQLENAIEELDSII